MSDLDAHHVWDLATIHAVQRAYAVSYATNEVLDRAAVDIRGAMRHQLAKRIRHEVEQRVFVWIDLADVALAETYAPTRAKQLEIDPEWPAFTRRFVAGWSPQGRPVVIRGGSLDGSTYDVPGDPWPGLRLVEAADPITFAQPDVDMPTMVQTRTRLFEVAGWSERERAWVLEAGRP